jgi:6-phosphogluconolactonase (cycloisomerase 2 family)
VIPSIPGDFVGDSTAAEIVFVPGTSTLYVSNCGHGSIPL